MCGVYNKLVYNNKASDNSDTLEDYLGR